MGLGFFGYIMLFEFRGLKIELFVLFSNIGLGKYLR